MKNKILKGVTGLAVMVSMLSMCAVDGEFRDLALIGLAVSWLWLSLFCFVNRNKLEGR